LSASRRREEGKVLRGRQSHHSPEVDFPEAPSEREERRGTWAFKTAESKKRRKIVF